MKRVVIFPDVEDAIEDGLVAVGGDLEIDTLEAAYKKGIFPWPVSVEFPLAWFSPDPRGILDFEELHIPRSFEKFLKKTNYTVTFNKSFNEVIRKCATINRKNQPSTWITPEIIAGYNNLFKEDMAYSVEVWNQDNLIGGLYGVVMGNFVSGESMFSIEPNASKLALHSLIKHLEKKGLTWLDTQMVTSVVENFGGKYISRHEFISRLSKVDWTKEKSKIF